jgi:hypothetical protein
LPRRKEWAGKGEKRRYSLTSWNINDAYYFDGFFPCLVEGQQRIGKSAYAAKSLAHAYGEWEYKPYVHCVKPNYEAVKPWMTFMPREYLDAILHAADNLKKRRGLIQDDAGFWYFALDWYDPFIKASNRFLQIVGTLFGTVMLTTPNQRLISSKILDALPELKICRIHRMGKDSYIKRPRLAKVYQTWDYPDGKKGGVKTMWEDKYNATLPDDFYNWYKPKRDGYIQIGLKLLKSEVYKLDKRASLREKEQILEKEGLIDDFRKVVGEDDKLKQVNEVIKMYAKE